MYFPCEQREVMFMTAAGDETMNADGSLSQRSSRWCRIGPGSPALMFGTWMKAAERLPGLHAQADGFKESERTQLLVNATAADSASSALFKVTVLIWCEMKTHGGTVYSVSATGTPGKDKRSWLFKKF